MSGRSCDTCADSLAGYFPGCNRCDNCTDLHGLEFEAPETETLADCLQDIAGGLRTDSSGFWIADSPV